METASASRKIRNRFRVFRKRTTDNPFRIAFHENHSNMTLVTNTNGPEATPLASDLEAPPFEDDAFNDNGEGTAARTKPSTPTHHYRARDSRCDVVPMEVETFPEDDQDSSVDTLAQFEESKWAIGSATIFVASSVLYLVMAYLDTDSWYEDDPEDMNTYEILYFWAAFGFLVTGGIEIMLARNAPRTVRMLYYLMTLAAAFGVASAILTDWSPTWSNISDCASTNLWALEGFFVMAQRLCGTGDPAAYDAREAIGRVTIRNWLWIADGSFVIGTFGDATTSWLYVFEYDDYLLDFSTIIFALMWLICAVVYLAIAVYEWNRYRIYVDSDGMEGNTLRRRLLLG